MANVPFAATLGEHASLWSIRLSLLLLVCCLALQSRGLNSTDWRLAGLWFLGALLAACHSLGALWTFHHGSQWEAFQSTAQQTEEMIGVRLGAGLYINYLFVCVWLFDSIWRIGSARTYGKLPSIYHWLTLGFLLFIAFNGAVVFKSGLMRWLGILCTALLLFLWIRRRNLVGGVDRLGRKPNTR